VNSLVCFKMRTFCVDFGTTWKRQADFNTQVFFYLQSDFSVYRPKGSYRFWLMSSSHICHLVLLFSAKLASEQMKHVSREKGEQKVSCAYCNYIVIISNYYLEIFFSCLLSGLLLVCKQNWSFPNVKR